MCQHEPKICPRCNKQFECKAGTIIQCQCYGIHVPDELKSLLEKQYDDCLCRNCLLEMVMHQFAGKAVSREEEEGAEK